MQLRWLLVAAAAAALLPGCMSETFREGEPRLEFDRVETSVRAKGGDGFVRDTFYVSSNRRWSAAVADGEADWLSVATGGFENPDVKAAYNHAKNSGMYKNKPYRLDSKTVYNIDVAYAMNDQMEYFPEICEAYWGENDYYPFNYEDLKEYDTQGFALMEKVWGKRKDK